MARQAATAAAIAPRSRLEPTVRVEQVALPALVEEARLLVLAVDLDQGPGRRGEPAGRHRLVVDAGHGATGRRHLADADERLRQPVEQRLDPRRLGPVADEPGVGPRPEREAQRVDEEALPGPGLAGDHVEAGRERDPHPLQEGEVDDRELEEATCEGVGSGLVRGGCGHDGRSWAFWRSRSQNGTAPSGSRKRIGRS